MLCCCRRRGKYTTTPVGPSYVQEQTKIDKPQKVVHTVQVPVHNPTVQQENHQSNSSEVTNTGNHVENTNTIQGPPPPETLERDPPTSPPTAQDESKQTKEIVIEATTASNNENKQGNNADENKQVTKVDENTQTNKVEENINKEIGNDEVIKVDENISEKTEKTQISKVDENIDKESENNQSNTEVRNTDKTQNNTTNKVDENIDKNTENNQVRNIQENIYSEAENYSVSNTHVSKVEDHQTNKVLENTDNKSDEMANRNRIKIPIDNSDIEGQVPLTSTRRSLVYSNMKEPVIEEETEPRRRSSNAAEDQNGNSEIYTTPTKVKFGEDVVQYFSDDEGEDSVQPRRKGIREPINVDSKTEIPKYPKSAEDILHLKNALTANDFLGNVLKEEALDKVIAAMHERKVSAGETIIEEGEPGNNMYVSLRGTYEIYVKKKLFATFSDKRVFGELAILYNSKRLATIKAVSDGKVWVLQRSIYQQIVVQSAIQDFQETLSFLRNVPLVNKLNEDSLTKIANLLKKEFFRTDTVIVREGEPGDKFYIIRAGSVTITKKNEGKVSELGRGAFFGERALLTNDRRQATVTADAPGVECLTLTQVEFKKHFNDLTMPVENKKKPVDEKPGTSSPSRQAPQTNEFSQIALDDLEWKATLGVGGFGRVVLVQHKYDSSLTFALKYLKKIDMLQQEQVEHVFNERDIQMNCNSIFIVRMYNTFKDNKYLYFLMESCLGGDLWTYLQKRKGRMVGEIDARFYAGCVLEAFTYLHERNYIYRDLKPENLLIDSKGYIKLTDFGFAKNLNNATKTYTFAGTPEYVAPEIIYNRGHDKSVDYWAFGILIFELLVGKTPFRSDDHTNMMTYNRILRGINSVTFPQHVTKSATHLIQKLCRPIPTDRLGNQKNGIQDIRNHKWFQGFDWDKLRNQKMRAPFVPKLSSNVDPRYFEKFNEDDDIPPDETNSFQNF